VGFEVLDGGDEVNFADQHHEVDGIEVLLTAEAAAEIGVGVDGGEELAATGTEEAETAFSRFVRPLELDQQVRDGNFVSQAVEQLSGEVFGHG
jgi:hypothetical protein